MTLLPMANNVGVPAGLYKGCAYDSCWHNKTEVVEAIKLCAKTNASLGLSYDPWGSFWAIGEPIYNSSLGVISSF
jgi:hypothetical protein